MQQNITIAIAEDHTLLRQTMAEALTRRGLSVLFGAGNGLELLHALNEHQPDIVLLDISMPVIKGDDAFDQIKVLHPRVKVIILSMYYSRSLILHYMERGVHAYLPKECSIEELLFAIASVYEKGYYYSSFVTQVLHEKFNDQTSGKPRTVSFTGRELDVFREVISHKTNARIGAILNISPRTVEWHRANIMAKTNSKNTTELIAWAFRNGFVA